MLGCSYSADLAWVVATATAYATGSAAGLGLMTSLGVAFMITWYSLRTLDRYAFTALLHAEVGVWASSPTLAVALRLVDGAFHIVLPCYLLVKYLDAIQLWMSPLSLGLVYVVHHPSLVMPTVVSRLHLPYEFTPPRSPQFWAALYKMELLLCTSVPILACLVCARSFFMYSLTLLIGAIVMTMQVLRSLLLPKIRGAAATIMHRLLQHGEIQVANPDATTTVPDTPWDIVVQDHAFWLDWMSDGLVAIGDSFVSGQWEVNPNGQQTLDSIVLRLLTLPVEARREMYQSWYARVVSLAARIFSYPPSSAGLIGAPVAEQYDVSATFRQPYMASSPYFFHGFGLWASPHDTVVEAQERTLHMMAEKLQLQPGDHVLDLHLASCGGVGVFFAKYYNVHVLSILGSRSDEAIAVKIAQRAGLTDQVHRLVVEPGLDVAHALSTLLPKRFQAIAAGHVLEVLPAMEMPRLLSLLRDKLSQNGRLLLDFVASPTRANTHAWSNKHIVPRQPFVAVSYSTVKAALVSVGWTILEAHSYADHYDKTYVAWNDAFQATWTESYVRELPESFRRTWEFYLLHTAACYRARNLQGYQVTLQPSSL
ncbi:hypothetical protein SDRG_16953 [Saprolegnia diclina VS20]|uniref:Cyclopropane-fatty-acyl-phospholipid synthase n=1 Tax=Saprolegnia diclina (strain VS20) TaxID=1156394 RepID=T0PVW5_SAPDV|nr:hypothetical protein SDRG_16953 [Saprolegnia diclina VS20]EQC25170.1 hypothetical protein SDRG_16953 [Saprolegnia diclina VS20]|eukprot:XP_008621401.1 hypothetical protein SDRG_16953 [Saprolegnia diclina VS20]